MKEKKPGGSRQRILDVAAGLFQRKGYHATGVQEIITGAGVAKGTFYGHYPSKEALAVAWLRQTGMAWNGDLQRAIAECPEPAAKVVALFKFLKSWLRETDFRGCPFLNTLAEVPGEGLLRTEINRHKAELRMTIAALVEDATGGGKKERENLGDTIYLLFEAAMVESQNSRSNWPVKRARQHVESLLIS